MSKGPGRRGRTRELIVQALYQMQIAGHDVNELLRQFHERPEFSQVEATFFDEAIVGICKTQDELEALIGDYADRPVEQLDPVERGILLLGIFELKTRIDIPYRVVINEAVNLSKRFGASDGHKFINALLDRAAPDLRAAEKGTA
ncbi:MAG: transcription antitermination factor NusB [Woeseia sp.]